MEINFIIYIGYDLITYFVVVVAFFFIFAYWFFCIRRTKGDRVCREDDMKINFSEWEFFI